MRRCDACGDAGAHHPVQSVGSADPVVECSECGGATRWCCRSGQSPGDPPWLSLWLLLARVVTVRRSTVASRRAGGCGVLRRTPTSMRPRRPRRFLMTWGCAGEWACLILAGPPIEGRVGEGRTSHMCVAPPFFPRRPLTPIYSRWHRVHRKVDRGQVVVMS